MANLSGFRYQRIFTKIWTDDKFMALKSDDSRYLFLYLLSSPHSNMIGLYKLPLKYIQADLNWELKRFTEPFNELLRERFIQYDEKVSLLLICNHLKHNSIENPHQVTAAVRIVESLPESSIILDTLEPLNKPFHKPLVELLQQRLGKPVISKQLEVISKKLEVRSEKDSKTLVQPPKKEKQAPLRLSDSEWLDTLQSNPAYQHVDIAYELDRMDAWLTLPKNKARKKTKQFILSWLNKIDRPVNAGVKKATQDMLPTSPDDLLTFWEYIYPITDANFCCIAPGYENVVANAEKNVDMLSAGELP